MIRIGKDYQWVEEKKKFIVHDWGDKVDSGIGLSQDYIG
jgi:hypothetical protein